MVSLKTFTRTIRMQEDLYRLLAKSAGDQRVSVNFLANQALRTFLEWSLVSRKFGLSTIPRSFLNRLMDRYAENECGELGRWVSRESFKPFAEYQFGELSVESAVEVFRRFGEYGVLYEFDEIRDDHKQVLFLKHDAGRKWSMFYSGLIQSVYKELLGKNVNIETTEELCISQIDLVR